MANKAIFITGAGSGIGQATARYFASQGWFIGLADVNGHGLDETAASLPAGKFSRHIMDVRDRDQWAAALADFVVASGGVFDVLFNNAGIGTGGQFAEMPPEEADRLIAINFGGVVNGAIMALPYLRKSKGVLLNTGSASGFYGVAGLALYSATKFGVRGLTEALDVEFAKYGVTVRSLMPGFINTPLLDHVTGDSNETALEKLTNSGIEVSPVEDVAKAAWDAVHSRKVHTTVGKMAKRLAFIARFFPSLIVRQSRKMDAQSRPQP
jgi:NAD(P)-dependent dehydrogenase (short-subunit alcohol dehydrogenase family)